MNSFWQGKRVFVTAPTSFLGAWTCLSLRHLGAQVFGFSAGPEASPNLFELTDLAQNLAMTYGDLRDEASLRQALQFATADIVIHLGESGSLQEADKNSYEVISKSVLGTTLLMELLRETASIRAVVVASSDKVYARSADNEARNESAPIAAQEILPTAKLCSELIALSYRKTFFNPEKYNKHKVAVATARIGQGMGGGDFAANSLLYQAVHSLLKKNPFEIRNPQSVRPWIHVLDQVAGLLALAEALYVRGPKLAPTYNFGADTYKSVGEVAEQFAQAWGGSLTSLSPRANTSPSLHGKMDSALAHHDLSWSPQWSLEKSLQQTARWYRDYYSGQSTVSLDRDVREFFR